MTYGLTDDPFFELDVDWTKTNDDEREQEQEVTEKAGRPELDNTPKKFDAVEVLDENKQVVLTHLQNPCIPVNIPIIFLYNPVNVTITNLHTCTSRFY